MSMPPEQTEPEAVAVPAKPVPTSRTLPFANWWPFVAGALLGIVLRLVHSAAPGNLFAAMNASFVYLAPVAVGAFTVYVAETRQRRSWAYYVGASMLANILFTLGTLLILIEGLICVIIVLPLFCLLGAVGGLVMGLACRLAMNPRGVAGSLAVLPVLLGAWPIDEPDYQRIRMIERSVLVQASPEQIWQQIHNTRDIRPEEMGHAWMYRIGVPLPIAGITQATPEGRVRKITMGKSIHFDQVVTDWQEGRHVRWTYRFAKDSFPPQALDDHVMIGGHYFDLRDTSYTLVPQGEHATELRIRMHYRVSTQFNWYADAVARLLIGNFEDVVLEFYRRRATQAA